MLLSSDLNVQQTVDPEKGNFDMEKILENACNVICL